MPNAPIPFPTPIRRPSATRGVLCNAWVVVHRLDDLTDGALQSYWHDTRDEAEEHRDQLPDRDDHHVVRLALGLAIVEPALPQEVSA